MIIRAFLYDVLIPIFDELDQFFRIKFNLSTHIVYNGREGFILFYDSNNSDISKGSISFSYFNITNDSVTDYNDDVEYVKFDLSTLVPFMFKDDSDFISCFNANTKTGLYNFYVNEEYCLSYKGSLMTLSDYFDEIKRVLRNSLLSWLCLIGDHFDFLCYLEKLDGLEGDLVF